MAEHQSNTIRAAAGTTPIQNFWQIGRGSGGGDREEGGYSFANVPPPQDPAWVTASKTTAVPASLPLYWKGDMAVSPARGVTFAPGKGPPNDNPCVSYLQLYPSGQGPPSYRPLSKTEVEAAQGTGREAQGGSMETPPYRKFKLGGKEVNKAPFAAWAKKAAGPKEDKNNLDTGPAEQEVRRRRRHAQRRQQD